MNAEARFQFLFFAVHIAATVLFALFTYASLRAALYHLDKEAGAWQQR